MLINTYVKGSWACIGFYAGYMLGNRILSAAYRAFIIYPKGNPDDVPMLEPTMDFKFKILGFIFGSLAAFLFSKIAMKSFVLSQSKKFSLLTIFPVVFFIFMFLLFRGHPLVIFSN